MHTARANNPLAAPETPSPESASPIPGSLPQNESEQLHIQTKRVDEFDAIEQQYLYATSFNQRFDKVFDVIRRISIEEKIFFTQNLYVMIKSGLSVTRALRTLALQTDNSKFKRILIKVFRNVERGETLAASISSYAKVFPPIFVSMIQAGEKAGQLEKVLTELTTQMKKAHELRSKIRGALMYPAAILGAMIAIGSGMIVFVIPNLISVFEDLNAELPLPTRILIGISNFINEHILLMGIAAVVAIVVLMWSRKIYQGKKFWHKLILLLPIIKTIAVKINLAKISQTLSSLLKTDMPIVDSMNLTANIVSNVYYHNSLRTIATTVEKGKTISSQMTLYPALYPPVVQQMIAVGEETGEISEILEQLAAFYNEDVSQTMTSLPSLIEPILIVVMGAAVGGMAVAIIMPMYSLADAI